MGNNRHGDYNHSVIKLAQYLAGLTAQQDIWSEAGKAVVSFLDSDVVAFGKRRGDGEIEIHHWAFSDKANSEKWSQLIKTPQQYDNGQATIQDEIIDAISETLESGFIASRHFSEPSALSTAFLPISLESNVSNVMMVGYYSPEPFSKRLLNVYLAVSGLIGTITNRLASERELRRHRRHLESLVKERTVKLTESNRSLKLEIDQRKRVEREKEVLISNLKTALEEVKKLSGLLPICSYCKKIRDDKGYWNQIEAYIGDHSEAEFSHGICQECAKIHYPDCDIYDE